MWCSVSVCTRVNSLCGTDQRVFGVHAGGEALQTERVQRLHGADVRTSRQQEHGQSREEADLIHNTTRGP